MLRKIGGIIAGVLVFGGLLSLIEWVAHQLGASGGQTAVRAIVVVAYFVATVCGGIVAARIARATWAAWAIALLALIGVLYTIYQLPHPVWMQIGSVLAPLLGGFVASRAAPQVPAVTNAGT